MRNMKSPVLPSARAKTFRSILLVLGCLAIFLAAAATYGLSSAVCPYCHGVDGNIQGNCLLHQRTGSCPEDYHQEHFNKSTCPWCGSVGHMRRIDALLD